MGGATNSTTKVAPTLLVTLILLLLSTELVESNVCDFPAIYNFGDSNSDTGGVSAAFGRIPPPYGETFFGQPSGRYSDGRLIIDFLAEKLCLPYLSAFLDSIGTSFRHGANFAASGSTIETATGQVIDAGFNPLSLELQLSQFEQFKNRTIELYEKGGKNDLNDLPRPKDFSKALYTMDIGQNDLHYKLITFTLEVVTGSLPDLINQTNLAIQKLHEQGARAFWIHNTGPIGCLPLFLINFPPQPNNTDEAGCIKSHNEVAQEFNKQLKVMVSELPDQLQDAAFTYVDIYSAKYSLYKDATKLGFVDPHGYCCKHPEDPSLRCFQVKTGTRTSVYATSCSNPGQYISWDNIHFTEAANHWVANHIWDGSLLDPPRSITQACQKTTR